MNAHAVLPFLIEVRWQSLRRTLWDGRPGIDVLYKNCIKIESILKYTFQRKWGNVCLNLKQYC